MNRNPPLPSPAPENATPSVPELPPEWVDRVLARLAAIFGSKMAALYAGQHPAAVRAAWSRALAGCTGEQLAAAINAAALKPWPPRLAEFVALTKRQPVTARPAPPPPPPGRRGTAWARRIMADSARYPESSLSFARDALRAAAGRACSPS